MTRPLFTTHRHQGLASIKYLLWTSRSISKILHNMQMRCYSLMRWTCQELNSHVVTLIVKMGRYAIDNEKLNDDSELYNNWIRWKRTLCKMMHHPLSSWYFLFLLPRHLCTNITYTWRWDRSRINLTSFVWKVKDGNKNGLYFQWYLCVPTKYTNQIENRWKLVNTTGLRQIIQVVYLRCLRTLAVTSVLKVSTLILNWVKNTRNC